MISNTNQDNPWVGDTELVEWSEVVKQQRGKMKQTMLLRGHNGICPLNLLLLRSLVRKISLKI